MKKQIIDLYKNFLLGKYSREEFLRLKESINSMPDSELEEMIAGSWTDDLPLPGMPMQTKTRIKANLDRYTSTQPARRIPAKWWNIAAVATIFLLSAATMYFALSRTSPDDNIPFIVNIEKGQKATVRLPDNTDVHLNAGTRLEYETANTTQRRVLLDGEAFFEVTHNKKRPFIVDVGELQIEVLGTSFNVQTYSNDDYIETSLIEGSIKVDGAKLGGTHYLKPMEQFKYSRKDGTIEITSFDSQQELGWMNDRLVFNSEPLHKVINSIERWYGVNITLERQDILDDLMSGAFQNEELSDVLESISIQYKVNYKIQGKDITIY